jgi:hypothetical protein
MEEPTQLPQGGGVLVKFILYDAPTLGLASITSNPQQLEDFVDDGVAVLVGVFVGDKDILGVMVGVILGVILIVGDILNVGVDVGTGQRLSSQLPNKVKVALESIIIFLTHVVRVVPSGMN